MKNLKNSSRQNTNPLLLLASLLLFLFGTVSTESRIEINVDSVLDPYTGGGIVSEHSLGTFTVLNTLALQSFQSKLIIIPTQQPRR